jgi:hypothetical protein
MIDALIHLFSSATFEKRLVPGEKTTVLCTHLIVMPEDVYPAIFQHMLKVFVLA